MRRARSEVWGDFKSQCRAVSTVPESGLRLIYWYHRVCVNYHRCDGYKIEDPVGLDRRTSEEAKLVADKIARQIAIDVGGTKARNVVVVDDEGAEVYKAPVKP